jgi:hypothetical protein
MKAKKIKFPIYAIGKPTTNVESIMETGITVCMFRVLITQTEDPSELITQTNKRKLYVTI